MRRAALLGVLALALSACFGDLDENRDDDRAPSPRPGQNEPPRAPDPSPPVTVSPPELCNAIDDDLDDRADEDGVCARACGQTELDAAERALRLPREGDKTVSEGASVVPELTAITAVPEFCHAPTAPVDPADVHVLCGQVLIVEPDTFAAKNIRVAPGGVLRTTKPAAIRATSILVCPNAILQASGRPARTGDGERGHRLAIEAERLVLLGTVAAVGGFAFGGRGGDGGDIDIHVDRLLMAGRIASAADPPRGADAGEGGYVRLVAEEESFFSGSIRSGAADVRLPVCCH